MNTSGLIAVCEQTWNHCLSDFPIFTSTYPDDIKKEKETFFSGYMDKFRKVQEDVRNGKPRPDSGKFFEAFGRFMKVVYDYSDEGLSIILHPDLIEVSKSFFTRAREFDPGLKQEELYQALRNVWIMNSLQLLLNLKVEITPSILAYSLLYPYTDNILDDPGISDQEKISFSKRFADRLEGTGTMADDHREVKISRLVGMIEDQFPRKNYPEVHESLKLIHQAQTRSLKLTVKGTKLPQDEVLSICFDKGGASVLADGFLVAGKLTPEVQRFFFGFGVWLQLADDIQDIPEDLKSGTQTLFSGNKSLERTQLTNRTFHFGRQIIQDIKYCNSDISIPFSKVILQSVEMMVLQSVGMNGDYFQSGYSKLLEEYSPISFSFLKNARKKGHPGRFKMITQWLGSNP
jgi:hypothetical protein